MGVTVHPSSRSPEPNTGGPPPTTRLKVHWARRLARAARALRAAALYRLTVHGPAGVFKVSDRPAVVFAPHQDDESLGCGGMIALKRRLGVPVEIIFLTDGGASPTALGGPAGQDLVRLRRREALAAAAALGVPAPMVQFLDFPDGQLGTLTGASRQRLLSQLAMLVTRAGAAEVYVPHGRDGTDDHQATHALVGEAVAHAGVGVSLLQYAVWFWWLNGVDASRASVGDSRPPIGRTLYLPIASVLRAKRNAVRQYRSQLAVLPGGFVTRLLQPYEVFFHDPVQHFSARLWTAPPEGRQNVGSSSAQNSLRSTGCLTELVSSDGTINAPIPQKPIDLTPPARKLPTADPWGAKRSGNGEFFAPLRTARLTRPF